MTVMSPNSVSTSGPLTFLDLPRDIHFLLCQCLAPASGPVFLPSSMKEGYETNMKAKNEEHYGQHTDDQVQCSNSLVALSSTCRYFRELIRPTLFKTVILRYSAKSVSSVKHLAQTDAWNLIKHLIFGGPVVDISENGYTEPNPVVNVKEELTELVLILSNLPPNLTSLTLDFPTTFPIEWCWEQLWEPPDNVDYEDEETLALLEQTDRYRAMLNSVFDAVSRNDISLKQEFELRIHSMPPFKCSTFLQPHFHNWLARISSFTLSLCSMGGLSTMNTTETADKFASHLNQYFFDHLHQARTFQLHGDYTFQLGLTPAHNHLELRLPVTLQSLSKVRKVSFKEIFICRELVQFLVGRMATLASIELIECHAGDRWVGDDLERFTWAQLFDALAEESPNELTSFVIHTKTRKLHAVEHPVTKDDVKMVDLILARQEYEETQAYEAGAAKVDVLRRRRWMFPYCWIADKHGELYRHKIYDLAQFLGGKDYDAYLRVIEIVEANMRRFKQPYFPTSGTVLPFYPGLAALLERVFPT